VAGKHPSYANPTIIEALCEIHFAPGNREKFSVNRPLPLFKLLQDDFVQVELIPETNLKFEVGETEGVKKIVHRERQRLRFGNEEGNRLLQVSPGADVFVYNVLPPYPGWKEVQATILRLWSAVSPILVPTAISRVGLRYINIIPHTKTHQKLADWIRPTKSIPEQLVLSIPTYEFVLKTTVTEEHRFNQTIKWLDPSNENPFGATLFDLDHIWEGSSTCDLGELLDSLHEEIWSNFDGACTPTLREYLHGTGKDQTSGGF